MVLVSGRPLGCWFGGDPDFSREFLVVALCVLACLLATLHAVLKSHSKVKYSILDFLVVLITQEGKGLSIIFVLLSFLENV